MSGNFIFSLEYDKLKKQRKDHLQNMFERCQKL